MIYLVSFWISTDFDRQNYIYFIKKKKLFGILNIYDLNFKTVIYIYINIVSN